MAFNSFLYAFFLLSTLILYRRLNYQSTILIFSSIVFYIFAGAFDTTLIIFVIVSNWLITRYIFKSKLRVYIAVLLNIGILFLMKYKSLLIGADFSSSNYIDLSLPLGISFYCFQCLAYQIDIHKDKSLKTDSFIEFSIFISFFPQLVAGPIVRAKQLLPQIKNICSGNKRKIRLYNYGLLLCALGLIKKIYFADSISPIVDDIFFQLPTDSFTAWKGAFLFGFQIYFDFSGYSDIALGSAYLFGIHLPLNFMSPYLSRTPQEFWKRWHITLSNWIRDYLYIPLGGNRNRYIRSLPVLLAVMSIAGLWHGANFTFIVWGFSWGLYIFIVRVIKKTNINIPNIAQWSLNMIIIMSLWVFFRSPSIDYAFNYLSVMYNPLLSSSLKVTDLLSANNIMSFIGICLLFFLQRIEMYLAKKQHLYLLKKINGPFLTGFLIGISLFLLTLPNENTNPFIYFRF